MDLAWSASMDNVGVTAYSVSRGGTPDYMWAARVKTGSTSVRNDLVGRYVDGNNFYFLVLYSGNVVLYKKVADSTSTLQSVPFTASTSAFLTLSLVVRGTSIQGYVDGVLRVQGTDTSLTAG